MSEASTGKIMRDIPVGTVLALAMRCAETLSHVAHLRDRVEQA